MYLHKARMNSEQREPGFSRPSALALSNMEEGMGHNVERAQALQEELVQRRASLHHDSAEAQALQGQEALLADIIEEEMAHQTQVLVLSHLHLQQAEEIKSQSEEIRHYPLGWRNNRLSWRESRSSRAGCLKYLFLL